MGSQVVENRMPTVSIGDSFSPTIYGHGVDVQGLISGCGIIQRLQKADNRREGVMIPTRVDALLIPVLYGHEVEVKGLIRGINHSFEVFKRQTESREGVRTVCVDTLCFRQIMLEANVKGRDQRTRPFNLPSSHMIAFKTVVVVDAGRIRCMQKHWQ